MLRQALGASCLPSTEWFTGTDPSPDLLPLQISCRKFKREDRSQINTGRTGVTAGTALCLSSCFCKKAERRGFSPGNLSDSTGAGVSLNHIGFRIPPRYNSIRGRFGTGQGERGASPVNHVGYGVNLMGGFLLVFPLTADPPRRKRSYTALYHIKVQGKPYTTWRYRASIW